jgi:hypothetical protein
MREGALFASMFGLGAGAVLVGVTVSRLVVGQAPERVAEEPPVVAAEALPAPTAEAPPAPVAEAPPPAVVSLPPAVVEPPPAIVEPPAAAVAPAPAPPPATVLAPAPALPAVVAPVAEPPAPPAVQRQHRAIVRKHRRPSPEETPDVTAAVPTGETEPAARPPLVAHAPIAIVRGGAARVGPGSRAPGPRIIHVDPH